MNYSLALELKNAGFPQVGESKEYLPVFTSEVYIPTLSELIEACGEKFESVGRNRPYSDAWIAFTGGADFLEARGSTPEEAVARLWLALNKKEGDLSSK